MSDYQIGKDVQELLAKVKRLEKRVFRFRKRPRTARPTGLDLYLASAPLLTPEDTSRASAGKTANSLAYRYVPPYKFSNGNTRGATYDSGSTESLFVDGTAGFDDSVGRLDIDMRTQNFDKSDEKGYRSLQAWYGFGITNDSSTRKLKITAEFFVETGHVQESVIDESGPSAVDVDVWQYFNLQAYKVVSGQRVKILDQDNHYHEHTRTYDYGEGGTDNYNENQNNTARTWEVSPDGDIEPNQVVWIYPEIWAGISFWTDGFSVLDINHFTARLDKLTAELM